MSARLTLREPPRNEELERLLERAKGHVLTRDEIRAQRVSWVHGQLWRSGQTKEEIARMLDEMDGAPSREPAA